MAEIQAEQNNAINISTEILSILEDVREGKRVNLTSRRSNLVFEAALLINLIDQIDRKAIKE